MSTTLRCTSTRSLSASLLAGVVWLAMAGSADAQCTSNASSCVGCHETRGIHPVLQGSEAWHVDHAFGDLCSACHGGDPAAESEALAHIEMRAPLNEPERVCRSCHEHDFAALAVRYRPRVSAASAAAPKPTPAEVRAPGTRVNAFAVLLASVLALVLVAILRRRFASAQRHDSQVGEKVRFGPQLAGACLGVLVAAAQLFWRRPIAAAGAFDKLAAYLGRWLFPDSQYYTYVMVPGITWQVWLMVGVLLGSGSSSAYAGQLRVRWLPDSLWSERFGTSRALRCALAFVGALLVQVGAGIAGGCTSGLAISGGAALSPAAFIFMAGMFLGGMPTAWLWHHGREG